MDIIANWVLLTATCLLFWRLVTTNHWTPGKKNLVAIVTSVLWKVLFEIGYLLNLYDFALPVAIAIANLPLAITMVFITLIVHWFND